MVPGKSLPLGKGDPVLPGSGVPTGLAPTAPDACAPGFESRGRGPKRRRVGACDSGPLPASGGPRAAAAH